jgi:hypothetical protein
VYTDCFGTSASPINYVVPANTTRVLSLKADIQNTANFGTITAGLSGDSSNLQGMTSSQSGSTTPVNGAALTLVSSSLTVAPNAGLGTQTVAIGAKAVKIGSYAFSASSAGGVNVNTVSIELTPSTTAQAFSNLKLVVNGTQFGQTVGSITGETTYAFSGSSAFNIAAGQTVDVDVYADTLATSPVTYNPATALVGYTGVGQVSNTSVTSNATVNGQELIIGSGAALSISTDQSQAATGQVIMGTTGNALATYRFTETSNHEAADITAITVTDGGSSTAFGKLYLNGVTAGPQTTVTSATQNATTSITMTGTNSGTSVVYISINGSAQQALFIPSSVTTLASSAAALAADITLLSNTFHATATSAAGVITLTSTLSGTAGNYAATPATAALNVVTVFGVTGSGSLAFVSSSAQFGGGSNTVTTQTTNSQGYVFNFANPIVVPQGSSVSFVLTGDAASYQSGGAVDGSTHTFAISSITAQGATSNNTLPSYAGSASGNPQTVLRSALYFQPTAVGLTSGRGKTTGDELADLAFQANAAGSIAVNKVVVTFSGTAASTSTFVNANDVQLIENNISLATGTNATVSTSTGKVVWTFNLGAGINGQAISPGLTRTWKLIVNDNDLASAPVGSTGVVSLNAVINTNADITFTDGLDASATSSLELPSFPTPIQLNSVSFAQGI